MAEDEYTVRYDLEAADNWELTKFVFRTTPRYWALHGALILGTSWLAGSIRGLEAGSGAFDLRLALGVLGFMAAFDYLVQRVKSVHRVRRTAGLVGPHELRISPAGLYGKSTDIESHVDWSHIDRVVETDTWIYLFLNRVSAVIVPRSAFATAADRTAFASAAQRWASGL